MKFSKGELSGHEVIRLPISLSSVRLAKNPPKIRAMATKDKRTEQLFSLIRNGAQLNVWDQIELVWRLSLPAIFAQISFVMVQYIDAAMVGHLGANPAASIGLVSSSLWLVWGLITSVTAGFTVQVAQRIGAKQFDEARSVLRQSLFVGGLISIAIAVVGVALSPMFRHGSGAPLNCMPTLKLISPYFVSVPLPPS